MKCHYCDNQAVKHVVWLKDKRHNPARIKLAWCGCDLMVALKKFWPTPHPVMEGRDYEVEPLAVPSTGMETIKRRLTNARHNLIAHPIAGIFWLVGMEKVGDWVHNNW